MGLQVGKKKTMDMWEDTKLILLLGGSLKNIVKTMKKLSARCEKWLRFELSILWRYVFAGSTRCQKCISLWRNWQTHLHGV